MFSTLYIFKYISTCKFVHLNYINFIYEKAYRFSEHETMQLTKYFSSNKNDCLQTPKSFGDINLQNQKNRQKLSGSNLQ